MSTVGAVGFWVYFGGRTGFLYRLEVRCGNERDLGFGLSSWIDDSAIY